MFSDCMMIPPCAFEDIRIPCEEFNRHFRSHKCFDNHKKCTPKKRTVCDSKRCCGTCGELVTRENHECNKRFCQNYNQKKEAGHLCFMRPLKNVLPAGDKVLYVFYDFETTQNTRYSETATLHIPNLLSLQQYCSKYEDAEDVEGDCVQCGVRKHSFWDDPVSNMQSYLCEPRPWVNKIIAIAHKAKAFDLQFILNRAILLKWRPELIMNELKIMCMRMEHLVFLDSVSFLPCSLRKVPEAFGLTASKLWYPHYFNTEENLDYVGPIPDASYYGANEMSESERRDFLAWYEIQKK